MPLAVNQGRYTLFTLAATNAKPLEWLLHNDIGNYQDMVGKGVDPDLWFVREIRYLGDSFTGVFPPIQTYDDGYRKLVEAIKRTFGKFAFAAFSQGAGVCSMVYKNEIQSPSGELYNRRDDFVGAVTFGNPSREEGHTIPGGTEPGGHGMFADAHRMDGSPQSWWDFANTNDPAACVGDDIFGLVISAASDDLCFGDRTGYEDVWQWIEDQFSGESQEWRNLLPDALVWIQRVFDAATIYYPYDPVLNTEPHARYHFPYTNLPNNSLSAVQLAINYLNSLPGQITPPLINFSKIAQRGSDPDRFRFIVESAHGGILSRDLVVKDPKVLRVLSGPCNIQFDVDYRDDSVAGIYFKPWAQWIHVEKLIAGQRVIFASGIVVPSQIDKGTGMMHLEAQGFSSYAKGLPALFNWNPIAVDVFEIVHKMWDHIQSYPQGDLGVTVYPALSGMVMLPGYAFDGQINSQNFYAQFIRASDKQDCGTIIDNLARDIPFDYVEQAQWNADRTAINKALYLGYPIAGVQQDQLVFVINENVIEATPHIETEIDWASDIIIDGWQPGTEFSATLTNADTSRFRRVVSEDDAQINSNERAAAWARRKLTRRQTPAYWESIIVDMGHPNAPIGSYDVGDRILVRGYMPWVGDVSQMHKIIAIAVDEKADACELTLKPEGMFTYDPIYYQGSVDGAMTINVPGPTEITTESFAPTIVVGTP